MTYKRVHKKTPSPAEAKMLRMVARSINATGTQPSVRELADGLGYSVHNYVHQMIGSLVSKGVVSCKPGRARSLVFNWKEYL